MKNVMFLFFVVLVGLQNILAQNEPVLPYGKHSDEEIFTFISGKSLKSKEFRRELVLIVKEGLKDTLIVTEDDLSWILLNSASEEIELKKGQFQNSGWNPDFNFFEFFSAKKDFKGFVRILTAGTYSVVLWKDDCLNLLKVPVIRIIAEEKEKIPHMEEEKSRVREYVENREVPYDPIYSESYPCYQDQSTGGFVAINFSSYKQTPVVYSIPRTHPVHKRPPAPPPVAEAPHASGSGGRPAGDPNASGSGGRPADDGNSSGSFGRPDDTDHTSGVGSGSGGRAKSAPQSNLNSSSADDARSRQIGENYIKSRGLETKSPKEYSRGNRSSGSNSGISSRSNAGQSPSFQRGGNSQPNFERSRSSSPSRSSQPSVGRSSSRGNSSVPSMSRSGGQRSSPSRSGGASRPSSSNGGRRGR